MQEKEKSTAEVPTRPEPTASDPRANLESALEARLKAVNDRITIMLHRYHLKPNPQQQRKPIANAAVRDHLKEDLTWLFEELNWTWKMVGSYHAKMRELEERGSDSASELIVVPKENERAWINALSRKLSQ